MYMYAPNLVHMSLGNKVVSNQKQVARTDLRSDRLSHDDVDAGTETFFTDDWRLHVLQPAAKRVARGSLDVALVTAGSPTAMETAEDAFSAVGRPL